jgi:hypothetical protein
MEPLHGSYQLARTKCHSNSTIFCIHHRSSKANALSLAKGISYSNRIVQNRQLLAVLLNFDSTVSHYYSELKLM